MIRPTPRAAAAAALLITLAACHNSQQTPPQNQSISEIVSTETTPEDRTRGEVPGDGEVISAAGGVDPMIGATPMRDRVAVIGLLNKRNGATRDITLKPGQAVRVGEVIL